MSLGKETSYSRRTALKTLGIASAATVAYPLASGISGKAVAGIVDRRSRGSLTVGLLLPASDQRPSPAASFRSGLELYLEKMSGYRVKLVAEDIGTGVSRAISASRRLVEREKADIVIGLVNSSATRWLREIFEKSETPFIEASAGERIADAEAVSPWIFRNSLALWESSYAMGRWGAGELGRRGVIATSFHDSGFDTIRAFRQGFERAGGHVADLLVSNAPASPVSPRDLMGQIASARPDFVCAFYSREEAAAFIDAYIAAGLGNIPLLGSGLMADTHELDMLGASALGMRSALSWSEGIDNAENRAFMASYRRSTGKPADAFALLGNDTGAMIASAIGTMGRERCDLREALGAVSFASPRGEATIDRETRSIVTPLYLSQVRRTSAGPGNIIAATLDTTSGLQLDAAALATRQGLLNSYLSV